MSDTYEQVHITSRAGWRAWLAANHETSPGVWAVTFKKQSSGPHVPAAAVAEEATAFGWVDSRPKLLDADRSQLLVTPRKARSGEKGRDARSANRRDRGTGGAEHQGQSVAAAWTVTNVEGTFGLRRALGWT